MINNHKEIKRSSAILKSYLLTEGISISDDMYNKLNNQGYPLFSGRTGGAGPAGGRYFQIQNDSWVNTPIWVGKHDEIEFQWREGPQNNIVKIVGTNIFQGIEFTLKIFEKPSFYSQLSKEGIKFEKLALLHGPNTLATTINQHCAYWHSEKKCKFCGIEYSLESNSTIARKSGVQILEFIERSKREYPEIINNITLTSGTSHNPFSGGDVYLDVVFQIHTKYPELPIHVQLEPAKDINIYQLLRDAGVSTIGLHIEILNDEKRAEICPGKGKTHWNEFINHFQKGVEIFGFGNVSSFIITGFEKFDDIFKLKLEQLIKLGVFPIITPAKFIPSGDYIPPKTNVYDYIEICKFSASLFRKYNIDPHIHSAGCFRCRGCSAVVDFYDEWE